MKKTVKIAGIIIGLVLLIAVRHYQEELFFDPYLKFFENPKTFENIALNENSYEIMLHLGFRYLLNGTLTLILIYFIFNKAAYVSSSFFMLLFVFVILFPVYYYFVLVDFRDFTMIGFYVRRFMIQPIILLLLVPAFYYLRE